MSAAADYIPRPEPAPTEQLIGAHYVPGWKEGTHWGWGKITPFPGREPLLGWYDEGRPEVADWEIKWALEHGISFFAYCWYRKGTGAPVEPRLGHAIHEGLLQARFRDRFKFCIMWENANAGGVASEQDLFNNLFPFWLDNYFRHPSYLKVDGKPVLLVYDRNVIVKDLGGAEGVRRALDRMRETCAKAGLGGLWAMCEYRGAEAKDLQMLRDCGFDHAFAYCWHAKSRFPEAAEAVQAQLDKMAKWRDLGILPFVPTITCGWDPLPWKQEGPNAASWLVPEKMSRWHLEPADFESLCRKVKDLMAGLPAGSLGRRMALLDNWNEWGEGHHLAPHQEHGFGYLDAVRSVFTSAPREHRDLVPADVGLGPYDSLFRKAQERAK